MAINLDRLELTQLNTNDTPDSYLKTDSTGVVIVGTLDPPIADTYADITELLAQQSNQIQDNFYLVTDASDDVEIAEDIDEGSKVYYHYLGTSVGDLTDYNKIAIPRLGNEATPKLSADLNAKNFSIKFTSSSWEDVSATTQAVGNEFQVTSPGDIKLESDGVLKLFTANDPDTLGRLVRGLDGTIIYEALPTGATNDSDTDDTARTAPDGTFATTGLAITTTADAIAQEGFWEFEFFAKSVDAGTITAFSDIGNDQVRAASNVHGLSTGEYVTIDNTTNYNGTYEIVNVPDVDNFDITATYVDTETGDWESATSRELEIEVRDDGVVVNSQIVTVSGNERINRSGYIENDIAQGSVVEIFVKCNTTTETIDITNDVSQAFMRMIYGTAVPVDENILEYDSNLDTINELSFYGVLTVISCNLTAGLTSNSYQVSNDNAATYTDIANVVNLQSWIDTNITGDRISGTAWRLRIIVSYGSSTNNEFANLTVTRE